MGVYLANKQFTADAPCGIVTFIYQVKWKTASSVVIYQSLKQK
jgi:hypothetical protein